MRHWLRFTVVLGLLSTPGLMAGCRPGQTSEQEADVIRYLERERIRALVDADLIIARRLHADDFQLIVWSQGSGGQAPWSRSNDA